MRCRIVLFPLLLALCAGCGNAKEKRLARKEITAMIGRQVVFPEGLVPKLLGDDIGDPGWAADRSMKVVIYTMPLMCSSCNLGILLDWRQAIGDLTTEFGEENLRFVFVFAYKDERELTGAVKEYMFDFPVYYDPQEAFREQNPFISGNPLCHTFLVDENNRIVLVGDPVRNPNMLPLYKEQVGGFAARRVNP